MLLSATFVLLDIAKEKRAFAVTVPDPKGGLAG